MQKALSDPLLQVDSLEGILDIKVAEPLTKNDTIPIFRKSQEDQIIMF